VYVYTYLCMHACMYVCTYIDIIIFLYCILLPDSESTQSANPGARRAHTQVKSEGNGVAPLKGS
jgi:hypothetical protein